VNLDGTLSNPGVTFSELGRPGDALPPTKEAVALYRELTAVLPDRYIPALATSLSDLGNILSALGRTAMLQRLASRLRGPVNTTINT
jgi:hypothetical protein